jgi:hypothetical protein
LVDIKRSSIAAAFAADEFRRHVHARHRRVRRVVEQLVLVAVEHGHVFRHAHAHYAARFEHRATLARPREDGRGFGQLADPADQVLLLRAPVVAAVAVVVQVARETGGFKRFLKAVELRRDVRELEDPAVAEVTKAAIEEVLGGEFADRFLIRGDDGKRLILQANAGDVDDGHAVLAKLLAITGVETRAMMPSPCHPGGGRRCSCRPCGSIQNCHGPCTCPYCTMPWMRRRPQPVDVSTSTATRGRLLDDPLIALLASPPPCCLRAHTAPLARPRSGALYTTDAFSQFLYALSVVAFAGHGLSFTPASEELAGGGCAGSKDRLLRRLCSRERL